MKSVSERVENEEKHQKRVFLGILASLTAGRC